MKTINMYAFDSSYILYLRPGLDQMLLFNQTYRMYLYAVKNFNRLDKWNI